MDTGNLAADFTGFDKFHAHDQVLEPITDMDDLTSDVKLNDPAEAFEFISANIKELGDESDGNDPVLQVQQRAVVRDLETRKEIPLETETGATCDAQCPMRERIRTIVYWRKPVTSGVMLACLLTLQISLMSCSAISVVAFMGLALFLVINGVRMYYKYVCKSEQAMLKEYLEKDITIPQDRVNQLATRLTDMANDGLVRARDIFFFKDVAASVKLIVLLYILTYVGAVFDFMTLVTIATVLAFTVPKFYETYQVEVDRYIKIGRDYYDKGMAKLQTQWDKLPVVGNKKQKPQ